MPYELPHLVIPGDPITDRFRPRGGGNGSRKTSQLANRQAHAAALRESLIGAIEASGHAREQWIDELKAQGVILGVEGWPDGFELALESLDLRGSGIELLSVQPAVGEPPSGEVATVFVPDAEVEQFFSRLSQYANEETAKGTSRHEKLVANIATLQRATLQQLWTDHRPYPGIGTEWWEIWLRRTGDERQILNRVAERSGWQIAARTIEFPPTVRIWRPRPITGTSGTTEPVRGMLARRGLSPL